MKMILVSLLFLSVLFLLFRERGTESSDGKENINFCSKGKLQSPILVDETLRGSGIQFLKLYKDYFVDDFIFKNFEKTYKAYFREDNDRYELNFHFSKTDPIPSITNSTFGNATYYLYKIFFRWHAPENGSIPTEHVFEEKEYKGEIQILTYNSKYGSYERAMKQKSDGLAIFAVFIDTEERDLRSQSFVDFLLSLNELNRLHEPPWMIEDLSPATFLAPDMESFIMYKGSLTYPPCTEIIKWILFDTPVQVPFDLFNILTTFLPGHKSGKRKLQPLNKRMLYFRSKDYDPGMYDGCTPSIDYNMPVYYKLLTQDMETLANSETRHCFKESKCDHPPPNWKEIYKACGKRLQSPINIDLSQVKPMNKEEVFPKYIKTKSGVDLLPIPKLDESECIFIHFPKGENEWEIENKINGQKYLLNRIRILIGNRTGSEHSIDGKFYPIELQFVNVNKKYRNITRALSKPDGLFIISKLFGTKMRYSENLGVEHIEFKKILQPLSGSLRYLNGKTFNELDLEKDLFVRKNLNINNLLGPTSHVFIYNGSLSEPPCSKNVLWMVIKRPGFITYSEYDYVVEEKFFFWLGPSLDINGVNEKRPIQPTHGRNVYMIPFAPRIGSIPENYLISGKRNGIFSYLDKVILNGKMLSCYPQILLIFLSYCISATLKSTYLSV